MMAFLVGRQVDREDALERQVDALQRNGSSALLIVSERQTVVMRNVDDLLKRVAALERGAVMDHGGGLGSGPGGLGAFGSRPLLDWPYLEGLRLDEAMHSLTLVTVGLYGQVLPNQNGAPIRVVVTWKYGFKSAKSLVRIRLTSEEPKTAWNKAAANEYGFYSNVNPEVSHPRWSQATERRLGELRRRDTLMFNGYADQVASLYAGMDLKRFY